MLLAVLTADHGAGSGFWNEYVGLLGDGPHWLFELTSNIIFDIILGTIIWGFVIKKVIIPRLEKRIHKDIDEEHGIEAHK